MVFAPSYSRDLPRKYALASESRNNFVAAAQNLNSCQKYLPNINFPFAKPQVFSMMSLTSIITHYDVIVDVVGCRKWPRWSGQRSTFSRTCRRLTELRTPCNATVSRKNARLLFSSGSTRFNPSFHLPFQNLSTTLFMTSRVFAGDHADDSGGSAERDDRGEPR